MFDKDVSCQASVAQSAYFGPGPLGSIANRRGFVFPNFEKGGGRHSTLGRSTGCGPQRAYGAGKWKIYFHMVGTLSHEALLFHTAKPNSAYNGETSIMLSDRCSEKNC